MARPLAPGRVCRAAVAEADSPLLADVQFLNKAFKNVSNEAEFFEVIQAEMDAGRCPKQLLPAFKDFYNNYKTAVLGSDQAGANEKLVAQVQSTIADCVLNQFKDPYTFPSQHSRLLEPYNYYNFGQRYVASLTDFKNSILGRPDRWNAIKEMLAKGENVVLLANHQTEADPGVFAHMLEAAHPELATDVIYVAGDRVVTDPLCKPFSMGRNLFCVHSKKHINDVPELFAEKSETNRKTVVAMARRLNQGGALIWIAPSGGRDRPKADGAWSPDPFDSSAVDLMYSLAQRAKSPSHIFPMAMVSYKMMPPPPALEKSVGERRLTFFSAVGISLCEELDLTIAEGEDKSAKAAQISQTAFESVCEEYKRLEEAIDDPSKRSDMYCQPWAK